MGDRYVKSDEKKYCIKMLLIYTDILCVNF